MIITGQPSGATGWIRTSLKYCFEDKYLYEYLFTLQ